MNVEGESKDLYLVFKLNEEIYGTQLLQVREVIESQPPKPIPNTIHSYMGVINVRGEIVGTIDLRMRFGYTIPEVPPKNSAMIIFNSQGGSLAVLTDQLEGVFHLNINENAQKPKIESLIPNDYILGIYEFQGKLITIIDLNSILDHQEITNLSQMNVEQKEAI